MEILNIDFGLSTTKREVFSVIESPVFSLEKISKQLDVVRGGTQHQAGSDSLVTGQVFFAIFDNVATEGRAKERQSVLEAYNLDIY